MKHARANRPKRLLAHLLCLALLLPLLGNVGLAQEQSPGFVVQSTARLELVGADVTLYQHSKTGALLMLIANEDTNRSFDITFRTPPGDDTGLPHIFEHATLGGSQKYPSKSLFFNLIHQTYNTYMNAMTTAVATTYPVASLSEAQLLRYVDYYTDSVLHPSILSDESIFKEEAWRYTLSDMDAPLTIAGTVYSEMSGSYDIRSAAYSHFRKTLFPGSQAGFYFGGNPAHIPEMSWQDLKDYHSAWYHPSNSLSILYGKIADPAAFMALLDGYFSTFEMKEYAFIDSGYTPLEAPVQARVEFPIEAGGKTEKGAVVSFGYALPDLSEQDLQVLTLLAVLLNEDSSPFQQAMKKQLPAASAGISLDTTGPVPSLSFSATGMDEGEAETLVQLAKEALLQVAEKGFERSAVEAVAAATRLDVLLTAESSSVGVDLSVATAVQWAASNGNPYAFSDYVNSIERYLEFADLGEYQRVIKTHLLDNPQSATLLAVPLPGQKEINDQALADTLAQVKAGMSQEELEAIVQETAQAANPVVDDAADLVKSLQAVDVASLPVERRIYEVEDASSQDGIRRIFVKADVAGVGQTLLMLDTKAIPEEDLHWYKLYTGLLGKLDTQQYDNATLAGLMTRYLYNYSTNATAYGGPENKQLIPLFRASWIAMDEDLQAGYDLVYELLYNTKLDDAAAVLGVTQQILTSLKQTINNYAYQVLYLRAFGTTSQSSAYFAYLNFLEYYAFLEQAVQLLEAQPEVALQKLQQARDYLHNSSGLISGFAGNQESKLANQAAADSFIAKLDRVENQAVAYNLPPAGSPEAIIVDSAVQYNLVYASYEQLGLGGFSGDLAGTGLLISDAFLYPQLRDQYGVYSVIHDAGEDGLLIFTYHDPNISESFAVLDSLGTQLGDLPIQQETLDGYILSAFSGYALSQGELAGAYNVLIDAVNNKPQERYLQYMEELKALTPEKAKALAEVYTSLATAGHRATAGSASKINQHQDLYQVIHNPFAVEEKAPLDLSTITDLPEDAWYTPAAVFALEGDIMDLAGEGQFAPQQPATMGEMLQALLTLFGVPTATQEEAVAMTAQFGLLPPETAADQQISREEMANLFAAFMGGLLQMDVSPKGDGISLASDAASLSPASAASLQFMLDLGMLHLPDNQVQAAQEATRADLALMLLGLANME